ncbi:MAG: hypothetical protein LBJ57_02740 [Prevotellaceae bacterium]|nr:hypothetical protein [Prevotellaceae bacterium]
MAVANLTNEPQEVITGNDNIVIVDNLLTVRGGRTLDTAGFAPEVIKAGHVIIKETAAKEYKPMPVTGDNAIATFGAITGGSSGATDGNYLEVALSGGSGSGASANVGVTGNAVTDIGAANGGKGYQAGDVLTGIAGGVEFSVAVASVNAAGYGSLPEGHEYAGILIASILTKRPLAGIMVHGTVNPAAAPYPMGNILAAVKAALPLIDFRED